jgi:cation diffusion facilitator CzcD-associated flavoprotein CzcO
VLVVGAGSSGVQIASERPHAGKRVYLSVGPHDRPPRAYRERDCCWWLGALGRWKREAPWPDARHVTIAMSGVDGGQTVDFRRLTASGMALVGRTEAYEDDALIFAGGLEDNKARGDANCLCYWTRPTPTSPATASIFRKNPKQKKDTIRHAPPIRKRCPSRRTCTFQSSRLFGDLSVLDNVIIGRHTDTDRGVFDAIFRRRGTSEELKQARPIRSIF